MSDEINTTPASAEGSSEAKEEITPAEPVPASVQDSGEAKPADAEASRQNDSVGLVAGEQAPEPIQTPDSVVPEPQTAQVLTQTAQSGQIEPLAESSGHRVIWGDLIAKGREFIAGKKRKKLDKIMTMFDHKTKITNDEVEKLLHVSDATATRYLSILEKEGKIQQNGKTGKGVSYFKL